MIKCQQKPLDTPEALEEWLRENRDCDSKWKYYLAGVAHGENAQHEKSYAHGYGDGWRDARLRLNADEPSRSDYDLAAQCYNAGWHDGQYGAGNATEVIHLFARRIHEHRLSTANVPGQERAQNGE
jgi:hypothetical protein